MAVQTQGYSASQQASAEVHLERRNEWRYVRIDGVRYVKLPSGTSGKLYTVRADARGCSCRWYTETQRDCSHMLAVRIAHDEEAASAVLATDDEISAFMATSAATFRTEERARTRLITSSPFFADAPAAVKVRPLTRYEALFGEDD
jgi:hypothetical protein